MSLFSATIRDHRGKRLPMFSLSSHGARHAGDFSAAEFEKLRNRLGDSASLDFLVNGWVLFATVLVAGAGMSFRIVQGRNAGWSVAAFVAVALAAFLARRMVPAANSRTLIAAMLEQRRCPSCAFPLDQVQQAPDRCVTCSECGGAWIIPTDLFSSLSRSSKEPDRPEPGRP